MTAHGHGDGDHLSRDQALGAISRITATIDVPVTADIERGYATDPAGVGETVRSVLAAGAVGKPSLPQPPASTLRGRP
ncbi:isocitrate lyase/phosphoenolpyruvate mutase family protein [Streptomyces sp. NPDC057582]|uniref:isocitrate lyase/phosphoenolpyruvate mutase family protein n=1 Tax=Streptomyces sp. NPDC057582 TaxID=3346174 RepID=UPI0036CF19D6